MPPFRKRIGYGKLGRVIEIDPKKWGESGGDNEPPYLLQQLATRNPDVEFVIVGKNSGWAPHMPNITNMWQEWKTEPRLKSTATMQARTDRLDRITGPVFDTLDGMVFWLGQHGTSNSPIPMVSDRTTNTNPQVSFVEYVSFIARGINRWRNVNPLEREEVWLLPDARNYLKSRDLAWPRRHPVLCQYDWKRDEWNERYGDTRSPQEHGFNMLHARSDVTGERWRTTDSYVGSGLELVGIPRSFGEEEPAGWEDRDHDFGILINEARNYGMRPELTRLDAMRRYVQPLDPAWVHGTWSAPSLVTLDREINPIPYGQIFNLMQTTKCTLTTPSSGSHWATAKPWESFATGIICFFHPLYDTQDHILFPAPDAPTDDLKHLHRWLRVKDPADLERKVKAVSTSRSTYEWLAKTQYDHFKRELERQRCVTTIERRLGL